MEPTDVLQRFLDVCSNKSDKCTRYSFASNGILEWFGRNVKDNNRIFEYIRYNISHQYEHIFTVAFRCEAFEEKPLHKATRQQIQQTAATIVNAKSNDIFETPPSCSASKEIDGMATPERKVSPNADGSNGTDEETSFAKSPRITRSSRKRSSHVAHVTSPSKRNKCNSATKPNTEGEPLSVNDETTDPSKIDQQISEIKYIEAIGTIRKLRKLKHRGIDARAKDVRIYESPTRQHWDAGNTKLKISYRENVGRSDVQFVLVIYQHIDNNPRCRRDLMTEFSKTCPDEPQKSEKKIKSNKSSKMRRLRF